MLADEDIMWTGFAIKNNTKIKIGRYSNTF